MRPVSVTASRWYPAPRVRFDAQISVFDSRLPACPCYACVFPPHEEPQETRCATLGVLAPLVGIVGSVQAAEAIKLLCGAGVSLAGRLQMLSGLTMSWSEIAVGTGSVVRASAGTGRRPDRGRLLPQRSSG
jgi:molybdopterin/thiamine biosynthesis adenylyltransferase